MRHIAPSVLTLAIVMAVAIPLAAQDDEPPNPLDVLLDAFDSPEGHELIARLLKQPSPDGGSIPDPIGDLEHPTGEDPGFTPDHIDITGTWAVELDPGAIELFTPTDSNRFWAPTGRMEVDPPNYDPFHTFTGDQVHDGSQYSGGALLFGFTLVDTPPVDAAGRCEYVVWVNDIDRGPTFVNNPNFPADPAAGTNIAFGLGINPADGPGLQSGFTLVLQESGGFAPDFESDVRALVTPRYVGITVPRDQIGDLAAINFYSFCAEEGIAFEPEISGADQTGLIDIGFEDFGAVAIETVEIPGESTTTTSSSTTTTTSTPDTTEGVITGPEDEEGVPDDTFPWSLVLIGGGAVLALIGWWLYGRKRDPCKELMNQWATAQETCAEAQGIADQAAGECEEAESRLKSLQAEREKICKAWPPACWSSEEGDWIEDREGNRITSRDIHMRKVALGEVWADYKAGKLTAGEVEAKWREMDTPAFRQEMRETDASYKKRLGQIDADIAEAGPQADAACALATEAQKEADGACAEAEAARDAYETCVDGLTTSSSSSPRPNEEGSEAGEVQRSTSPESS